MLLRRAHRSGYNLKDVLGSAAAAGLEFRLKLRDTVCANLARAPWAPGQRAAISQAASARSRQVQRGRESAAGAIASTKGPA